MYLLVANHILFREFDDKIMFIFCTNRIWIYGENGVKDYPFVLNFGIPNKSDSCKAVQLMVGEVIHNPIECSIWAMQYSI